MNDFGVKMTVYYQLKTWKQKECDESDSLIKLLKHDEHKTTGCDALSCVDQ